MRWYHLRMLNEEIKTAVARKVTRANARWLIQATKGLWLPPVLVLATFRSTLGCVEEVGETGMDHIPVGCAWAV